MSHCATIRPWIMSHTAVEGSFALRHNSLYNPKEISCFFFFFFFASLCKKWIMDHNTAHLRLFLHWFCLVNYKLDLKISAFCHCWKSRLQCKAVWIASRWQPSLMHLDMKSLLRGEKERKKTGKKPTKKSHTMFIVFYSFCIVLICFSFAAYL